MAANGSGVSSPGTICGQADQPMGNSNDTDLKLPDEISLRQQSVLRAIGNRPDTVCKECFHYGHDRRSLSYPAKKLQIAIQEGTLVGFIETQDASQDVRDALTWQESLPENLKVGSSSRERLASLHKRFVEAWTFLIAQPVDEGPSPKRHKRNPNDTPVAQQQQQQWLPASIALVQQQYAPQPTALQNQSRSMAADHTRMGREMMLQIIPYLIPPREGTGSA
jgi:hypothetical protein